MNKSKSDYHPHNRLSAIDGYCLEPSVARDA